MAGRVEGTVRWISGGKPTSKVVDAEQAFSDPDQAAAQVICAEASGDRETARLARLAFRQFQGRRFRGANKPKAAKKGNHRKRS